MKSTATKTIKKIKLQEGKGNSENTIPEAKENCRNVFVEELKEIYFNEKALMLSIPVMIQNATTDELVDALKIHLQFTLDHLKRLEDFFCSIDETDIILKYDAMYGSITPKE
jgi:ferritin-like metal-binding protein YciE